MMYQTLLY
ncbi:hypothetical protein GQ600_642 [Phytophthora cactorum]|nr:hypothetical protein GQ600_642 [Phytophthora cactorum]